MAAQENVPLTIEAFAEANKADLVLLARIVETAERFEDMCTIMGKLVKLKKEQGKQLCVEERNMLSVAYKNVVGQRRAAWRALNVDENQHDLPQDGGDGGKPAGEVKDNYKKLVEAELKGKCLEVLNLLEKNLVKDLEESELQVDGDAVETQVFYLKMCGDYYRYLAEFNSNNTEYKKKASAKYEQALALAKDYLKPTHPTRLGLALNASVCYYEIMEQSDKACKLAKEAFDQAIQQLDSLSDSTYKDSTLIMQLLRDNLTIWTSEKDGQPEEHED